LSFTWPAEIQSAIALTFDVDGECTPLIMDRTHAHRRLSLLSESMYGLDVGLPLILDLLAKYEIKSTFFVPGFTARLHPTLIEHLVKSGHEVGHHGYYHERSYLLTDQEEEEVVIRGIEVLTQVTGQRPVGYRSPAWEIKPSTPALLHKHNFVYDSSLMGHFRPYRIAAGPGELIELPVQWMLDDMPFFAFASIPYLGQGISNPEKVLEIWRAEFEGIYDQHGCFVLTMHPQIIGRPSRVLMLERLIRFIGGFPGVWFAPLAGIADHCLKSSSCDLIDFPRGFFEPAEDLSSEKP